MRRRPFLPTVLNLATLLFDYADCKFIILKAPTAFYRPSRIFFVILYPSDQTNLIKYES